MKNILFLLPFLMFSLASQAQNRVDVYRCSYEIPGFGSLVDEYVQLSWAQGRSLGESHSTLDRMAGSSRDCRSFKAALEQLVGAPPVVQRPQPRPRPDDRRSQPEPRRDDDEEEDEQVEQQRQGRRGLRLPRLPQWPQRDQHEQRERTSGGGSRPRILIVTDEASAQGARIVQQTFATSAPWNCMRVEVVIEVLSRQELNCQAHSDGRARIVLCSRAASSKAQALRRRLGAKRVLIVADTHMEGGNGGPTPVVSANYLRHSPKAGMHEIMHTMGFDDTYDHNAQYAATSGDIMSCSSESCYVLPQDYGTIARALGTRLPDDCSDRY
jgi:hypothetical protein